MFTSGLLTFNYYMFCACQDDSLLGAIKNVAKCLCFAEIIDLSDESGNLKNLLEHKGEYATQHLKARHSFILIKVDSECVASFLHVLLVANQKWLTGSCS